MRIPSRRKGWGPSNMAVMTRLEQTVVKSLSELAQYHRCVGNRPRDYRSPLKSEENTARAWTIAEIGYLKRRLERSGFAVKQEGDAKMRLPPDLVVFDRNGRLGLHFERETRGWEWNDVIGVLAKLLVVSDAPAPVAAVILAGMERSTSSDTKRRIDLVLRLATKLLAVGRRVKRLYLALWLGRHWINATLLVLTAPQRIGGEVVVREILPTRRRLPLKTLNGVDIRSRR